MFSVSGGTTVSKFVIGTSTPTDSDVCNLILEGDEIVEFTSNGTYVIDSLVVRIRGTR